MNKKDIELKIKENKKRLKNNSKKYIVISFLTTFLIAGLLSLMSYLVITDRDFLYSLCTFVFSFLMLLFPIFGVFISLILSSHESKDSFTEINDFIKPMAFNLSELNLTNITPIVGKSNYSNYLSDERLDDYLELFNSLEQIKGKDFFKEYSEKEQNNIINSYYTKYLDLFDNRIFFECDFTYYISSLVNKDFGLDYIKLFQEKLEMNEKENEINFKLLFDKESMLSLFKGEFTPKDILELGLNENIVTDVVSDNDYEIELPIFEKEEETKNDNYISLSDFKSIVLEDK